MQRKRGDREGGRRKMGRGRGERGEGIGERGEGERQGSPGTYVESRERG